MYLKRYIVGDHLKHFVKSYVGKVVINSPLVVYLRRIL